jgi:alpha-glucosidase
VRPLSRVARFVRPDEMHQAFNFTFLTEPWKVATVRDIINRSLESNDAVGAPPPGCCPTTTCSDTFPGTDYRGREDPPTASAHTISNPTLNSGSPPAAPRRLPMLALPGSAYL